MKLRSALSAAAALPLALGLAACGSDQPEATGYKPSAPASTPAATPTTAVPQKVAPAAAHLNTASFLPAMKKGMAGKNSVRVTMRMVSGGETMTVTGVQTMSPVAMKMDMKGAAFGGRMKLILVKDTAYLSTSDLPAGKYVKIDPDSDDPMAATLGSLLDELDPTKTFDAFDSGLTQAEYVKTETLDGRKVDRYAVTVDVAAAMKAQGQKVPAGMPKNIVYTIWMGSADHLMYKVVFEMQGVSMTMTASDWGKPVTIKAPAAGDIVRR